MTVSDTLSGRLRSAIDEKNMTQYSASVAMGVSEANVSRWLKGAVPSARFYDPICAFLGIGRAELGQLIIAGEEGKQPTVPPSALEVVDVAPSLGAVVAQRIEELEARISELERLLEARAQEPPAAG